MAAMTRSSNCYLVLGSYEESSDFDQDDKPEPGIRWHTVKYHSGSKRWCVRVMFTGTVKAFRRPKNLDARCIEFQEFLEAINFEALTLKLLDDTVTMISLTVGDQDYGPIPLRDMCSHTENVFIQNAYQMHCDILEDPDRIIYPIYEPLPDLRTIQENKLQSEVVIAKAASKAVSKVSFESGTFVYKKIKRSRYRSEDTKAILNEIEAVAQFRRQKNIVQPAGIVVSPNPYQTYPSSSQSPVITGILLQYYSEGSLQEFINQGRVQNDQIWVDRIIRIGEALDCLHRAGGTHLDMKPSDIVIGAEGNAVLVGISGSGRYTIDWLSPEMKVILEQEDDEQEDDVADTLFLTQASSDCWAFGMILSALAEEMDGGPW